MELTKKLESLRYDIENDIETDKIKISVRLTEIENLFFEKLHKNKCEGCKESTGETKLWCCNACGKRKEDF